MSEPEPAIPSIRLHRFSRNDQSAYQAYLELKYEVFVAEQGWHSLAAEQGWHSLADHSTARMAREDGFDARGRFRLATTEEKHPIGIVRGIPLKEGFPHRELLDHHLHQSEVSAMSATLSTINALAVRALYRRTRCRVDDSGWTGTIGKLLLLAIIRDLEAEGMQAALATVSDTISARLFESLGFFAIDPPQRNEIHPGLIMTNVGLVFGSPQHVRAQKECGMWRGGDGHLSPQAAKLGAYFEGRGVGAL